MVAWSRTRPPTLTSSTRSRTRSQPLSLLSIARLKNARSRARCSSWSPIRIDQMSLDLTFLTNEASFVRWVAARRRSLLAIEDDRLSEPTAPSRSGQGRTGCAFYRRWPVCSGNLPVPHSAAKRVISFGGGPSLRPTATGPGLRASDEPGMGWFLPVGFRARAHGSQTFARWAAWDPNRDIRPVSMTFSRWKKSPAFAPEAQRTVAGSENHGLENAGSVCHAETE